jgi:P-type Cu+ transporter
MKVRDPVCGMEIDPNDAAETREHMGETFHFCSKECAEKFDASPHTYVDPKEAVGHLTEPLAGSLTTGFNPTLPFVRTELPIVGLNKERGRPGASAIETALRAVPGVQRAATAASTPVVAVEYDPSRAGLEDLAEAVRRAGYRVGGAQTRIGVKNLLCASCVGFIEDELKATPGVLSASVSIGTGEATIEYLPEKTRLADLNQAIESVGYRTRPATSETPVDQQEAAHEREYQALFRRFLFAAIVAIPVLLTAYPKFIPVVRDWPMETLRLAWIGAAILTLPVLFWSGGHFFTGAWSALKHRSANMNTLIATGTGAAWLYSTVAILLPGIFPAGTAEPFYDVVAVVIASWCWGRRWSCGRKAAQARRSRS